MVVQVAANDHRKTHSRESEPLSLSSVASNGFPATGIIVGEFQASSPSFRLFVVPTCRERHIHVTRSAKSKNAAGGKAEWNRRFCSAAEMVGESEMLNYKKTSDVCSC